ncbi:MAG: hypothetical protein DDT39_00831 [Firmicutes bacterium]|nr:hypothetical protein [candidate division NPL-UPA2 bacterium]MBT9154164.1 hypothetical protein [candidate division NPL-UPA2 bacterium]
MRRSERGFTLIEMLVAVAALGMVAVMVTALYVQGMHAYSAGQAAGLVIADVRFAVENMAARLREARPGTVVVADANRQVTFEWWDRSLSPPRHRTIVYRLSGTDIQLNSQPMASFVQTLQFVLAPDGRSLTITVTTVSSVPGSRPGGGLPFTLTTRVALRN